MNVLELQSEENLEKHRDATNTQLLEISVCAVKRGRRREEKELPGVANQHANEIQSEGFEEEEGEEGGGGERRKQPGEKADYDLFPIEARAQTKGKRPKEARRKEKFERKSQEIMRRESWTESMYMSGRTAREQ